jgi:hypothetical protein
MPLAVAPTKPSAVRVELGDVERRVGALGDPEQRRNANPLRRRDQRRTGSASTGSVR